MKKLDRALEAQPKHAPADWSWTRLQIGQLVHREDDPAHLGRIEGIRWSIEIRVRWLDTNWVSEEVASDLVRARCSVCGWKLPRLICPHCRAVS